MRTTICTTAVLATLVAIVVPAWSQATWEGPTGVFYNPLALTLAQGKSQASAHYLDLQPQGSLTTFGYVYGGGSWEAGITHANLSVGGSSSNINIIHGKYVLLPFKDAWPQVAVGALARETQGGRSSNDIYVAATKVFPASTPIIASLTVRNTNGAWSGLLGKTNDRATEFGGFVGVQVTPKLIVGAEDYGQPQSSPWQNVCFRWTVSPETFVDGGLARLNSNWKNQIALALTHQW